MSFDEVFSLRLAQNPLHQLWSLSRFETNPPLFYLILSGWIKLVGSSPIALRSLSVVAGLLSVLGGFFLTKELAGKRAALISTLIFSLSPFMIYFSREARMYPYMIAAALWSFYFFWKYFRERKTWQLVLYLALITIAGLLHLSVLVLIAVHFILVFFVKELRPMSRLRWVMIHLPSVMLFAIFILRTIIARAPFAGSLTSHWLFHSFLKLYYFPAMLQIGLLSNVGFFGGLDVIVLLVIAIALVWYFFKVSGVNRKLQISYDSEHHERRWWLASITFLPIFIGYMVGINHEKFFVLSLACWLIILAIGLSRIEQRLIRTVVIVFVCVLCFISIPPMIQGSGGINWPGLVKYVYANAGPKDLVLVHVFHEKISFDYYDAQHTLNVKGIFPNKETQTFQDIMIYNPYPIITKENVNYLQHLTTGYNRVWLIDTFGNNVDYWNSSFVRDWFTSHGWNIIQKNFFGVSLTGAVIEYDRIK